MSSEREGTGDSAPGPSVAHPILSLLGVAVLSACSGDTPLDPSAQVVVEDAWSQIQGEALSYSVTLRNRGAREVVLTSGSCTPRLTVRLYFQLDPQPVLAWDGLRPIREATICPTVGGSDVSILPGESATVDQIRPLSPMLGDSLPRGTTYELGVVPVFFEDLSALEVLVGPVHIPE